MSIGERVTGTVQWFNADRGFGFITGPHCSGTLPAENGSSVSFSGSSYYVHFSRIDDDKPYKSLSNGQIVTFEPFVTSRGNHLAAGSVRPVIFSNIEEVENGQDNH